MPSWGRTSNPQKAVPCLTVEGVGHLDLHCYMTHGQLSICFPSLHQVPIDVTAGWAASPVGTRPPGPHFNSWVDWSKFLAQGNNNTKVAQLGIEPGTFRLPGGCPNHLAMLPQHTHTQVMNVHSKMPETHTYSTHTYVPYTVKVMEDSANPTIFLATHK